MFVDITSARRSIWQGTRCWVLVAGRGDYCIFVYCLGPSSVLHRILHRGMQCAFWPLFDTKNKTTNNESHWISSPSERDVQFCMHTQPYILAPSNSSHKIYHPQSVSMFIFVPMTKILAKSTFMHQLKHPLHTCSQKQTKFLRNVLCEQLLP